MFQPINVNNKKDENENPAGGSVTGMGIDIRWQDGPLGNPADMTKHNGAFVEGVLAAAVARLTFFQDSKFACRENALAITKIEEALHWLGHRTANRMIRGVEGTHQK